MTWTMRMSPNQIELSYEGIYNWKNRIIYMMFWMD